MTHYMLRLGGDGRHLDLSQLRSDRLPNIEVIDIRGAGNNALSLTLQDVERISASRNVSLHADAGDTVAVGPGWSFLGTGIEHDSFVRIFAQNNTVVRMAGPYEWSNPVNRLDVNADGSVEPRDVLNVVNALNSRQVVQADGALVDAMSLDVFPGFLFDVHPDGFLTPQDALSIINYLNEQPRSSATAEGEGSDHNDFLPNPMTGVSHLFDLALMELSLIEPESDASKSGTSVQSASLTQRMADSVSKPAVYGESVHRPRVESHDVVHLGVSKTAIDELCVQFVNTSGKTDRDSNAFRCVAWRPF
jgi:hypothetical protein